MRPGPPRGASLDRELTVTDELAAPVAAGSPPVCTTPTLLAVAERACRDLLAEHLEAGEVAVVVKQDLSLRAPIPQGATATVTATVALVTPTSVTYEVLARHRGTMVARGSLEHRVVDGQVFAAEIAAREPAPLT